MLQEQLSECRQQLSEHKHGHDKTRSEHAAAVAALEKWQREHPQSKIDLEKALSELNAVRVEFTNLQELHYKTKIALDHKTSALATLAAEMDECRQQLSEHKHGHDKTRSEHAAAVELW